MPSFKGWALLCCLVTMAGSAGATSLSDVIDKIRPGVVGVGTARPVKQPLAKGPPVRFLGTGFAVAKGNLIITNHHVVPTELDTANKESLAVFVGRGKQTRTLRATLLRSDITHDLAVLKVEELLPALPLASDTSVREGQEIAFTGFPIGVVLGLYPVTHRGIVSVITPTVIPQQRSGQLSPAQVQRLRNPFDVYQLDATAYPGNSGSPVYDRHTGEVIGVINSVFIKQTKETLLENPSGITYAIPVKHVHDLLNAL